MCLCSGAVGDLNSDGRVNVEDLAIINSYLEDGGSLPAGSDENADIDENSVIDASDRDRLVDLILFRDISAFLPSPDIELAASSQPSSLFIGDFFNIQIGLTNDGGRSVSDGIPIRIYFSKDAIAGNSDDVSAGLFNFDGVIAPGASVNFSPRIQAPNTEGDYYIVLEVGDRGLVADEAIDAIFSISDGTFQVVAPYSATVSSSSDSVFVNQALRLIGQARNSDGTAASFVPVTILVSKGNLERQLSAITDAFGNYSLDWVPQEEEAGVFSIGAKHPGAGTSSVQDSVSVLGLEIEFTEASASFSAGSSGLVSGTATNNGAQSISGLAIRAPGLPDGLDMTYRFPAGTSVPAGQSRSFEIEFSSPAGTSLDGQLSVFFESGGGLIQGRFIDISVAPLEAALSIPSILPVEVGVLRGGQKTFTVEVENLGNTPTGLIRAYLPNLPWLGMVNPNPIASVEAKGTRELTFILNPSIEVPLNQFEGTIVLQPQSGEGMTVPFIFRTVSDLQGDLDIVVEDELTYFTAEAPRVEGASVRLRDVVNSATLYLATSSSDGLVTFTDVPEGQYYLEASSPEHLPTQSLITIIPGKTNRETVFISKNFVTYEWTVEPIEIEDSYRISVRSTFETNIPAPVVIVTPGEIDVAGLTENGNFKVINFEVTNVGLIEASEVRLNFPSSTDFLFTSSLTSTFSLPAKSSVSIPVVVERVSGGVEVASFISRSNSNLRTTMALYSDGVGALNIASLSNLAEDAPEKDCDPGTMTYSYFCSDGSITRGITIPLSGANCGEAPPIQIPQIPPLEFDRPNPSGPNTLVESPRYEWFPRSRETIIIFPPSPGVTRFNLVNPDPACIALPCWAEPLINCLPAFKAAKEALGALSKADCILDALDIAQGQSYPSPNDLMDCICEFAGCLPPGLDCLKSLNACDILPVPEPLAPSLVAPSGLLSVSGLPVNFQGIQSLGSGGLMSLSSEAPTVSYRLYSDSTIEELAKYDVQLSDAGKRLSDYLEFFLYVYGSVEQYDAVMAPEATEWHRQLRSATSESSPSGRLIDEDEFEYLRNLAIASSLNEPVLSEITKRWQLSEALYAQGLTQIDDVPVEMQSSFMDQTRVWSLAEQSLIAAIESEDLGYLSPFAEMGSEAERVALEIQNGESALCARVVMQIDQSLVLTRSAFRASLNLSNNVNGVDMEFVDFDFSIVDSNGEDGANRFFVEVDQLVNIEAIDGLSSINGETTASITWVMIPNEDAATLTTQNYRIGGTIRFLQNGQLFTIEVIPAEITVQPDAALKLKYFHQRDVYSDDPFTEVVEPSEPFALAVMVENEGAGLAKNLSITSAQPEIVENESGLLIDFQIISTEVDGVNASPSLQANFGELNPGGISIATWQLQASLQGLFIDYDASFEHETGNGDPRLSLIKDVEIFEMIRQIEAPGALEDGLPDFFINAVPDIRDLGDTIHLSDGSIADVSLIESFQAISQSSSGSTLTAQIDVLMPVSAWGYLRGSDPFGDTHRLVSAVRSDGVVLSVGSNIWQTDRTFVGLGRRPVQEAILHLVDFSSSGSYILTYEALPVPDTQPPTSALIIQGVQNGSGVLLQWSGADDTAVARYDVYVSTNGGDFALWLENTSANSAVFEGETGVSYAFYTVAKDFAGNEETASTAGASSIMITPNRPPVFEGIEPLEITEGRTLVTRLAAVDPDGSNSDIRFGLIGDYPSNLTLDPTSGWLSWPSTEADGGQVLEITVSATDGAIPAASTQQILEITVLEANQRPIIEAAIFLSAFTNELFELDILASDQDTPIQSLSYRLGSDAPDGMTIGAASGRVTWTPDNSFVNQNIPFQVIVEDSGDPIRSTTADYVVSVISTDPEPLLPALSDPLVSPISGLVYDYYQGAWTRLPESSGLYPYKSGFIPNLDTSVRERSDGYVIEYSGYIEIPESGTYTFFAMVDDALELAISDTEVLLLGAEESEAVSRFASVGLEAGLHPFSLRYLHRTGGGAGTLMIEWESLGLTRATIPDSAFKFDLSLLFTGVAPNEVDLDLDGIPDLREAEFGFDPADPDSDNNGILDGLEDADEDDVSNAAEIFAGLNPFESDSDFNGVRDDEEDIDGDYLTLNEELAASTDPFNPDSDGDLWNDETEVTAGSDPLDSSVTPAHQISAHANGEIFVARETLVVQPTQVIATTPRGHVGGPVVTVDSVPLGGGLAQPALTIKFIDE